MEKNFSNRFNPYLPNLKTEYIPSRFNGFAYKCLYLPNIFSPYFITPNLKTGVKIKDKFICIKENHSQIELACSCGFYSFKRLEEAWEYSLFKKDLLIVKVKMLGDVIEHDIGYRSAGQLIQGIVNTTCTKNKCDKLATSLAMKRNITLVCDDHKGIKNYSFEQIKKLGLTVFTINPN